MAHRLRAVALGGIGSLMPSLTHQNACHPEEAPRASQSDGWAVSPSKVEEKNLFFFSSGLFRATPGAPSLRSKGGTDLSLARHPETK